MTSLHLAREASIREDSWAAVAEVQARLRELLQVLEAELPAVEELAEREPQVRRAGQAMFDAIALAAGARGDPGSLWVALHALEVPAQHRR